MAGFRYFDRMKAIALVLQIGTMVISAKKSFYRRKKKIVQAIGAKSNSKSVNLAGYISSR
jgi:hypothetical protein